MKNIAKAGIGLALLLAPFLTFASTDDQIKASLVQQLLSMFVVEVNSLDAMQGLVAQSSNPSQFDSFSGLVANQLSQTTAQLDVLLNDPNQGQIESLQVNSTNQQNTGGSVASTPSLILTDNLAERQPISTAGPATVWGGNCDKIGINSNIEAHFINPETGLVSVGKQFVYSPMATNTVQTIFVSADGLSTSTIQVPIGPSIYEAVMAKDPTGGGFNKYSSTSWSSKAIGRGVDPTTGLCN